MLESLEVRELMSADTANFMWMMQPQITPGVLPNTSAYVNPVSGYGVDLNASATPRILPTTAFSWSVTLSGSTRVIATATGEKPTIDLQQGNYDITLKVTDLSGGGSADTTQPVQVKDVLIVSIGDSYASGEGNPDIPGHFTLRGYIPAVWATSSDPSMNTENADAHRSMLSGPALFAQALQAANPHEAVTFVSVANSGATIQSGLLGPMQSIGDPNHTLPAEVTEAKQIVGNHPIDLLTISIGANDIGFSERVQQLIKNTLSFGYYPTLSTIQSQVNTALATLPAQYQTLENSIKANLNPAQVMVTEYADSTKNQHGEYSTILNPPIVISKKNLEFAYNTILVPLNQAVSTAAQANGWKYVSGLVAEFKTHGYSSSQSWFVTFAQSLLREGMDSGTLHPNHYGQVAVSQALLAYYAVSHPGQKS